MLKMQTFLRNGDQKVGGYGNPYLRLHRVLAGAKEHLDAQMLLDPLEEQFHPPALAIQVGNQFRLHVKVVGQKNQAFSGIVLDHYATQRGGVVLARIVRPQHACLIAQHRGIDSNHWVRVAALEFCIALGARHEEGLRLVNDEQSSEIQIAPVHHVEGSGLQHQIVHDIDFVSLAVGNVNEAGDVPSQIEQGMQLDSGLGRTKWCPRKYRQTQIDGAGIEGIHRRVEFHTKRLLGIQRSCHANQMLGEVGIDLPGACSVRIGQRVARNRLTAKPHVVQPPRLRTQIDLDVAQRLAVGQLREGHGEELVQTREVIDLVFASVIGHTAAKHTQRQIPHELRKYELALVHGGFWRKSAKNPKSDFRRSNRDQTQASNLSSESLTYDAPM